MEELHIIRWGMLYFYSFTPKGDSTWVVGSYEAQWLSKQELEGILAIIKLKLGDIELEVEVI